MRRDWNVIRRILLSIDSDQYAYPAACETDHWTLERHLELMRQGGLVETNDEERRRQYGFIQPCQLTWLGQEFLSECSNTLAWATVTEMLRKKGITPPFCMLRELLQKQILEQCEGRERG